MSFKCQVESNIATTELDQDFPGQKKLLPSSILSTDRDQNGMLKDSMLSDWLSRLEGSGLIPDPKKSTASSYVTKVKALLTSAKEEYCFYDSRYRASLQYLFTGIRDSAANTTAETQQLVEVRLTLTAKLNRKVNDIVQIINKIAEKMIKSSDTLEKEIKEFNENLKKKRDQLEEQNKIITSNEATMRLQKEMVKYSEEKASYSDNLLKMYSFLNIVALGLLVYVYKAAGDE